MCSRNPGQVQGYNAEQIGNVLAWHVPRNS